MLIDSIRLQNFRCHSDTKFEFNKSTFIQGENGSGKTSIVEAVFLLLNLKSFKETSPKSIKSFESDFLRIEGTYSDERQSGKLIYFFDESRTLKENGVVVQNIPDYLSAHPVFCFSPDMSSILAKEQRTRRSFIDRVCFYYDKSHLYDLRNYNRLLLQKNAELVKHRPDKEYVESINEQLVSFCDKISLKRLFTTETINKKLHELYKNFGGNDEFFSIDYISNNQSKELLDKEIKARKCLFGIHRDRFYSKNIGRVYDKFSSYGQKKTFELLVLYAILIDVEEIMKTDIITLLDDFEAGLDEKRSSAFFSMFEGKRQVIMTGVKNRIFGQVKTISL